MNWNLIWWFFGVCATLAALKFVAVLFKSLFNKDTMHNAIGAIGDKISDANEAFTDHVKKKAAERKAQKEKEEREKKAREENVIRLEAMIR